MALDLRRDEPRERPQETPEPEGGLGGTALLVLLVLIVAAIGALGYLAFEARQRTAKLEQQVATLNQQSTQSAAAARLAAERAAASESAARTAAQGRQQAEEKSATAQQEAESARREATSATENAARAQAEADAIKRRAEADIQRLEKSLDQIAETRRTSLGLVMNLGSEHLKFEFNKAELRASDRELLSRVAGILATADDYTISVVGHTDDVGSADYNQKLSERRAQAVRDYLVKAGIRPDILSVEGAGKSRPLVKGTTDAARAKNRRVELGIAHAQVKYGR